jgi:uncharacterized protein (DUF697 family)
MLGLRNMYRVFNESRRSSRGRATVAVLGSSSQASELATLLGAQREARGAEVVLSVRADGTVEVSGKAVEDPDEVSLPESSERAVREELAPRVAGALDEDYLIPLGRGYPLFRHAVCEELVKSNARQNALIGALPIPGADMPVMTANQGRMVLGIAAAHGEDLTMDRTRELAGVLAAGFGLRALGRQVLKLVPFGGWLAAAALGYAGTLAMGRATILYFERGGQRVGEKEMASIRDRARKEAGVFISRLRERRGDR